MPYIAPESKITCREADDLSKLGPDTFKDEEGRPFDRGRNNTRLNYSVLLSS